ncbi:MAG: hypothetical protein ACR5KV_05580 [Wolbachia sp.]
MPKYVDHVAESIVLKVYTNKKNAKIRVFSKTKDGEVEETLSKQQIVEFLNLFTNIRNHEIAISKSVEHGIIKDIEGIRRENGKYVYKVPDLSAKEQYNKLFESEQAIQFNLNDFISDSISKIAQLRDRFEEILDFNREEGLCHPLNYFITFMKLENRKDFVEFLESGNIILQQDFIDYIDERKEQTIKLLMMQFLSQFLPIFIFRALKGEKEIHFMIRQYTSKRVMIYLQQRYGSILIKNNSNVL